MWPFKKNKKINEPNIVFDTLSNDMPNCEDSVSDISSISKNITLSTEYTIKREVNGYIIQSYSNGHRNNKLFISKQKVIDYINEKLDELEQCIRIEKLKQ